MSLADDGASVSLATAENDSNAAAVVPAPDPSAGTVLLDLRRKTLVRRRILGVVLLLSVVIIWVLSSELMNAVCTAQQRGGDAAGTQRRCAAMRPVREHMPDRAMACLCSPFRAGFTSGFPRGEPSVARFIVLGSAVIVDFSRASAACALPLTRC